MQKLKSLLSRGGVVLSGAAGAAAVALPAHAEVDITGVTSAITGATTQGESVGGLVIAAVAALVVIGIIIAIVRKI